MTKEEILAMEAGDELDKAVAESLGYQVESWETFRGKPVYRCRVPSKYPEVWEPLRPYSTAIRPAWLVVEEMRSMEDGHGRPLLCCLTIYSDHDLAWDISWRYSELSDSNDGHKEHRLPFCYEELPIAICKAALLARLAGQMRLVNEQEKKRG